MELHSPLKFEKTPASSESASKVAMRGTIAEKTEDKEAWGNRGYISSSYAPEIAEPAQAAKKASFQNYKVQKSDTLQKISLKFFGTTKKWQKIFEANKNTLKAPNKIYPGQTLVIPVEGPVATEGMQKFK
ncbi:MAG: LysM peptidoglycan-binding domain-containing protein [Candidatus Omnitrophota bacterium]|nr:MAG: LysM peptidoglycan-binding domain-containing protein [Candidatus Omnitrophota bacterium]